MKFNSKLTAPAHLGEILENVFSNNFPVNFDDHFQSKRFSPAVNIKESESAFLIEVLTPGISKDEIKIDVDGKKLTISYENTENNEHQTDNYIRKEFKVTSFKRSFSLNEKVEASEITATYDNGVLLVNVPKKEEVVAAKRTIAIS